MSCMQEVPCQTLDACSGDEENGTRGTRPVSGFMGRMGAGKPSAGASNLEMIDHERES